MPALTPLDLRITNFILSITGILATCFRLWRRKRAALLWWDDAWAVLAMVFMIIFVPTFEVFLLPPAQRSQTIRVAVYYLGAECYIAINWASKISILFTVIRISWGRLRRILYFVGIAFGVVWIYLAAQVIWTCETRREWNPEHTMCIIPLRMAIIEMATDVVGDAILIIAPIFLIWELSLTRAQKIRVVSIFSTTLITTTVSLNHACMVILHGGGLTEALSVLLQVSISLIVCNLSVIIACCFGISTEEPKGPHTENVTSMWFGNTANDIGLADNNTEAADV